LRESPWFQTVSGASAFTRTLELGAGEAAVTLPVLEETNATASLFRLAETGVAAFERDGQLARRLSAPSTVMCGGCRALMTACVR
jgi:hypothetical protein